jgi:hypothetical protein
VEIGPQMRPPSRAAVLDNPPVVLASAGEPAASVDMRRSARMDFIAAHREPPGASCPTRP